jgi:CRP-like cAMP-binding protein
LKPGTEALRALPFFTGCAPELLTALNDSADLARCGPDEVLFRPGDRLTELNFLTAGQIGLTHPQRRGDLALVDVILPVRPLCLSAALLGLPAPAGAQTLTSVRLIVLPVPELHALVAQHAVLTAALLDCALRDAFDLTREMCDLKLRSSAQRLADYLIGLVREPELSPARFVLPFEKRLLAAKIGCSQENLSRAFAALRRVGVETQAAVVVLKDLPALRAFAGSVGPAGASSRFAPG